MKAFALHFAAFGIESRDVTGSERRFQQRSEFHVDRPDGEGVGGIFDRFGDRRDFVHQGSGIRDDLDSSLAHPHVGEFNQIVVVMVKEQLPQMLGLLGIGLVAILLVAVLAASMSTADSNLHALSAVVTRDIYDRFVRPTASENERAWVGRFTIIGATLLALWMVNAGHTNADFAPLKMIVNLMFAAIGFSCQLLPVTLDMLFIRRSTRAGVMAGMIAGIAVVFLFTPFPYLLFGRDGATPVADSVAPLRSLFDIGFTGFVVNAAVFALVSAFTRKLDPERAKKLALDMDVSSPE